MSVQASSMQAPDIAGVGLSALCLIHCLALPLFATVLPLAGAIADMEMLHQAFVVVAVFAAGLGALQARASSRMTFLGIAMVGLALLIAGAFVEAFHEYETALTVAGAVVLASAHILRWRSVGVGEHPRDV